MYLRPYVNTKKWLGRVSVFVSSSSDEHPTPPYLHCPKFLRGEPAGVDPTYSAPLPEAVRAQVSALGSSANSRSPIMPYLSYLSKSQDINVVWCEELQTTCAILSRRLDLVLSTILPTGAVYTSLCLFGQSVQHLRDHNLLKPAHTFSLMLFLQYLHLTVCLMILSCDTQE